MAKVAQPVLQLARTNSIPRSANQDIPKSTPLNNEVQEADGGSSQGARSGHLTLGIFSPVNQNGSFEFDRVLKTGMVQKRTGKTKTWKPIYLVLRPNLLSIYKNPQESRLQHQITLSELTAVAALRDKKQKRQHVFGLFTPAKNYHFEADSAVSVREWVELIRREARIDEDEAEIQLQSPVDPESRFYTGFRRETSSIRQSNEAQRSRLENQKSSDRTQSERLGSSSPDLSDAPYSHRQSTTRDGIRIPPVNIPTGRPASYVYDYSGNEMASFSDLSDSTPGPGIRGSSISLTKGDTEGGDNSPGGLPSLKELPSRVRDADDAQAAGVRSSKSWPVPGQDQAERVIWQGYLLFLRTTKGLRQWKRIWLVLRAGQLTFYKTKDEYRAITVLPISSLVDAVERDPLSKSKRFCMQIIGMEKSYRLCAADEEDLSNWLGALKSVLAKRKDLEKDQEKDKGKGKATEGS